MIIHFLNFVIFLKFISHCERISYLRKLNFNKALKYTELRIIRVRTAFYISMRTHSPTRARMTNGRFISQ